MLQWLHILLHCTTLSPSIHSIDIMRKSGKGQQMLLWKNQGKSDQPFSVLISAKPQWLTLMFFGKRSFGSSMCGHVHLISAKWENPDRNHDLFWVGTSQNLSAKEMLYAVLACAVRWGKNRGRLTWRLEDPGFRASGAASERCAEVGASQAL